MPQKRIHNMEVKKMEYKDIWNELCFHISRKSRNTSERDFQITAESLFEKLGWSQYKGEIIAQKPISVGSSNSVKPDIVVKNGEETLFVIELKKPNITMSDRNVEQLFSYMRFTAVRFNHKTPPKEAGARDFWAAAVCLYINPGENIWQGALSSSFVRADGGKRLYRQGFCISIIKPI
jgi:hypothetical protein